MTADESLVTPPPFVKPIRIPDNVCPQIARPPVARAGENGRWLLSFLLSESVPAGSEVCVLFHGGRNVKGIWQSIQVADPEAEGHVTISREGAEAISPLEMRAPGIVAFKAPEGGLGEGDRLEVRLGGQAGACAPETDDENVGLMMPVVDLTKGPRLRASTHQSPALSAFAFEESAALSNIVRR